MVVNEIMFCFISCTKSDDFTVLLHEKLLVERHTGICQASVKYLFSHNIWYIIKQRMVRPESSVQ